jgi:hypothetical protein
MRRKYSSQSMLRDGNAIKRGNRGGGRAQSQVVLSFVAEV